MVDFLWSVTMDTFTISVKLVNKCFIYRNSSTLFSFHRHVTSDCLVLLLLIVNMHDVKRMHRLFYFID